MVGSMVQPKWILQSCCRVTTPRALVEPRWSWFWQCLWPLLNQKQEDSTKLHLVPCICHWSTPPITSTCQTLLHSEYVLRDSSIHIWFAENGWDARHQYSDKNSLVEWINIVHVECSASAEWVREMEDLTILVVWQNSTCALFPFFSLQVDIRICKFIKIWHHAFKKSHLTLKKMHDANAQRVCSTTQGITYPNNPGTRDEKVY